MVNNDGLENTCSCFNLKGILVDEENSGPVAQWITRLTTDQKIPGSNPAALEKYFTMIETYHIIELSHPINTH